jgi:hypothetical protein
MLEYSLQYENVDWINLVQDWTSVGFSLGTVIFFFFPHKRRGLPVLAESLLDSEGRCFLELVYRYYYYYYYYYYYHHRNKVIRTLQTLFFFLFSYGEGNNIRSRPWNISSFICKQWDFKFSRRRVWCSELSSGIYFRVKWLSTDVSEVRTASIPDDGGSTHLWNVGRQ